jgi:multidrug efflux pump subunit AcrA (membrane-fusion protein)
MTQNQIAYMNALETKRHNQMTENEAMRSNMAKEGLEKRGQNISQAHYLRSDLEAARANRAQEQLKETAIGVDYAKLAETHRSNLAQESIGRYNATTNRIKANSGAYLDYSTAGLRQSETALKDLEASYTISRTNLTDAETATERARYYNEIAQVGLTQAQREKVTTETELMPVQVWGQTIGNVLGGVGKMTSGRNINQTGGLRNERTASQNIPIGRESAEDWF